LHCFISRVNVELIYARRIMRPRRIWAAKRASRMGIIRKRRKDILKNGSTVIPPAQPLPPGASPVAQNDPNASPATDEIFVGSPQPGAAVPSAPIEPNNSPAVNARIWRIQKILIVGLVATAALLFYSLSKSPSKPARRLPPAQANQPRHAAQTPVSSQTHIPVSQPNPENTETTAKDNEPLSLQLADELYIGKDYVKAFDAYTRLRTALKSQDDEFLRDFLQLRMALCMEDSSDLDQADQLFKAAADSRSPAVRTIANYHCCLLEMDRTQFLKARTRAYKAIATAQALTFDWQWAMSLERNCRFLAAEAITRNALSLCDADKDLPPELWRRRPQIDPFIGLSQTELRAVLSDGSQQLDKGVLSPQISRVEPKANLPQWSVVCHGPSIEELLARLAANAGLDVRWTTSAPDSNISAPPTEGIRRRAVTLYMPGATTQQIVATAAGSVGLLARLDEKNTIEILNPTEYTVLSEHTLTLIEHAISLWQQLLLTYYDDERLPNAHFALALLQAQKGQVAEAISEHKLIANRFSLTPPAPFSLLHSSRLKTAIRDYPGAAADLKQLIDQYPDSNLTGRAHLYLADTTMRAGLFVEAGRLYRKVCDIDPSSEAQSAAALGAGKCAYETKDYQGAVKWLTQYIQLVTNKGRTETSAAKSLRPEGTELYSAYFTLGQANLALGNPTAACEAFQYTCAGTVSKEKYLDAISALVEAQIQQDSPVEALKTLENMRNWPLSEDESTRILLLKSKILRAMGLIDEAVAALGDRVQYLTDPRLKTAVSLELAKCHIDSGNLQLARANLAEILGSLEPGPLAQQVALEIADVCLRLDQVAQTVSLCTQVLDSTDSPQTRQKALELLAAAHSKQKNYDRATLALLGQWNNKQLTNKTIPNNSANPKDN